MYGCSSAETRLYWSESTPIAQTSPGAPASTAASNEPRPEQPGGRVDDVSAGFVLRRCDLLGTGGVVESPEVRRLRDVVHQDLDVRVHRRRSRRVAGIELLDEVVLDTTDEADRAGLALERSGGADEERTLFLGEGERCHVRQVDDLVDDREARVGVVAGDLGHRVEEEEAVALDEPVSFIDEALQASGSVAFARRCGFAERDAEVGGSLLERCAGGVVERLVAAAGHVVAHADGAVAVGRCGAAVGGFCAVWCVGRRTGVVVATACCEAECGDDADGEQLLALDHVLPFRMKMDWFTRRADANAPLVFTRCTSYPLVTGLLRNLATSASSVHACRSRRRRRPVSWAVRDRTLHIPTATQ